ncbi:hypothetical protein CEXT_79561 [Caerostris extrusa]|uniref:Uncharacterized protein n=1 Tax=Caerostris extrusa TaxID=172846 RepID=A0AAV4NAF9_CAEEX|nr:hypothetical protein CEXT_79561 [Caerostris extrusa]
MAFLTIWRDLSKATLNPTRTSRLNEKFLSADVIYVLESCVITLLVSARSERIANCEPLTLIVCSNNSKTVLDTEFSLFCSKSRMLA